MKSSFVIYAIYIFLNNNNQKYKVKGQQHNVKNIKDELMFHELWRHEYIVKQFYENRMLWKTTNLGDILFKNFETEWFTPLKKQKTFSIYIWNKWSILYTGADLDQSSNEILSTCSVKNCIFTRKRKYQYTADVVLTNTHKGQYPIMVRTNPKQIWVLMTLESPMYQFAGARTPRRPHWEDFVNKFNWIMSYRIDADVPIPYGRVVPLSLPVLVNLTYPQDALETLVPYWNFKQTNILIATIMSNCGFQDRMRFITKFLLFTYLDVYGDCAIDKRLKHSCPPGLNEDCSVTPHYLFYLSLENSSCRQYLTEKIYFHAYGKGAIPVIWGALLEDCDKLLPPHSFLHVDHFNSFQHLIKYMTYLSKNKHELLKYHLWRKHFAVVQEHGFFGTKGMQLCRLCEALNYNFDKSDVYTPAELGSFLNVNKTCKYQP